MSFIFWTESQTHVSLQEVQSGFHQHQSVSDQSGLSAVHVQGTLVQVLDHTGYATHPALTVQPLGAACQTQRGLAWCGHIGDKPHDAGLVRLTHNFLSQLLPHPGMQQVMRELLQLSHICQSLSEPQGLGRDLWRQRTKHNAI